MTRIREKVATDWPWTLWKRLAVLEKEQRASWTAEQKERVKEMRRTSAGLMVGVFSGVAGLYALAGIITALIHG